MGEEKAVELTGLGRAVDGRAFPDQDLPDQGHAQPLDMTQKLLPVVGGLMRYSMRRAKV